jgi:hypothetical protein
MNIGLFDKAVNLVASKTSEQLDLGNWQWNGSGEIASSSDEVNCGTIACAAGWIALDREFQSLGVLPNPSGVPRFGGSVGYGALATLFDITEAESYNLFYTRNGDDFKEFGHDMVVHMTDRQLWLSRARMLRARYVQVETSNTYWSKRVEVTAFTFDQIIDYGRKAASNLVNGMPWSFTFMGYPVTHERDDLYLIQLKDRVRELTPESVLVIGADDTYVYDKKVFEATYERPRDSEASNGVIAAAEALITADRAQVLTQEYIDALDNAIKIQRGELKIPKSE